MSHTCEHGREIVWLDSDASAWHIDGDGRLVGECAVETAPPWAHRLLDAYLTGEPLDFGGEIPPPDIRERLDRAATDGTMGKVRQ